MRYKSSTEDTVCEEEIRAQHGVTPFGRLEDVREVFHAVPVERRLRHPAVVALAEAARDEPFGRARG